MTPFGYDEPMNRVLGLFDSSLLVIGSVFGSGIFLTTGIVAGYLPFSGLIWIVWAAGGLITMAGALCYGELGSLFPQAGGPYVYLREAYGPAAAFLFGWTFFWIIAGGGVAALAVGFSEYAVGILGGGSRPLIAIAAVVLLTLSNIRGIKTGARLQSVLTIIRVGAIGGLIAGAVIFATKAGISHIGPLFPPGSSPGFPWTAFGAAFVAVFWAYDGWYSVNCAAEEITSPGRTIPRSLALGTGTVLILYLAANIVYSIALPMEEMRGMVRIGEAAAASLFGSGNAAIFSAAIAMAVLGCLGANILFCARVPFAMSRDGLFPSAFGKVHPATDSPANALLGQMIWASVLCLSGTYERLIEFVMFASVLFYAATAGAVLVLRRKMPEASRPYRVWGYPLLPVFYILINFGIFAALVLERPLPSLAGAAIMLTAWPAFRFWNRGSPCLRV